jgi:dTDP-4-dehydrorhamnose 3,5-epimerase
MIKLTGEPLDGVVVQPLASHQDERGSFVDIFQASWPGALRPTQWSVVHSHANVLRGMHLHAGHDEYFMLLEGSAFVGLRDVRPDSPTRNRSCLIELHARTPAAVMFPRGLIHGWFFAEESVHVQSVSESYDDYHPHDNLGCHWSDPALEIPWPCTNPILSERAADFPPLNGLLERVFAAAGIWPRESDR